MVAGACGTHGRPALEVLDARAPAPASPDVGVVYFTVRNDGTGSDQLLGATTTIAQDAEVHQEVRKGLLITMLPTGPVRIPAHRSLVLSVGGTHLMLIGLNHQLHVGQHFTLTLDFRYSHDLTVNVPVVPYTSS